MEAIRDGTAPPAPISLVLNFALVEVGDGRAAFEYTPSPEHRNPMGAVHGGIAMTLLDSAAGVAVHTTLEEGRAYTTLETNVHMVRTIRPDDEPLRAEGEVVHRGRTVATSQARLLDAAGRVVAHGTSTCLILDLPG
jgi:uncharacterized protein (TIGR00369 family)